MIRLANYIPMVPPQSGLLTLRPMVWVAAAGGLA